MLSKIRNSKMENIFVEEKLNEVSSIQLKSPMKWTTEEDYSPPK